MVPAYVRLIDSVTLGFESAAGRLRGLAAPEEAPEEDGFLDEQRWQLARLARPWATSAQLLALGRRPRAPGEPFSFAVLGDAEPGRFWVFRKLFNSPGVFEDQIRAIQGRGVDFSVQLGDMVSKGTVRNYLRFFRDLGRWELRVPYLTAIGNHDRRSPHGRSDAKLYRSLFGRTNYAFDRGGCRFVSLDTSGRRVTPGQLTWLDRVLRAPGHEGGAPRRKFVFTHIPPAPVANWSRYAAAGHMGAFHAGARELTRVLSRRGVDRVYLGHIHAFGVQDYEGVRYVLTGGGGSPLFPVGVGDCFHHYLVVSVGPHGIRETLRCLDGRTVAIPEGKVLLSRA